MRPRILPTFCQGSGLWLRPFHLRIVHMNDERFLSGQILLGTPPIGGSVAGVTVT
jgi:hypothetical protein